MSICSGIEAASVAWEPLGWKAVGFSEIEPFPCAVLAHRFPNIPNYGDATNHAQWPIEPGSIDILVFGSPCQSFSVAGLRKGLADPRGDLALVILGFADRVKPRWIVWENVPGVLSSNGGKDFGSFLGALGELGYGFAYRVLNAENFGVAQRRRRVFVVGCFGDWKSAAQVLFEPESLLGDPPKSRKKGQGSPSAAQESVGENGLPVAFRKSKRAQSETDDESWVEADKSNTLNNFDLGDTRTTHAIVEQHLYENHAQDSRVKGPLDVSPTIHAKFGTGGGNVPLVGAAEVRRLTAKECERLQGFPDDWTMIPWKGKPADQCSDLLRYKCCGNSMAVPVMRWIGERIAQVENNGKKS